MRPDVAKYFKLSDDKKSVVFTGDTLTVLINERFEGRGCLSVENGVVKSLGVLDATINDTVEFGLCIPAIITMRPSAVDKTSDGKYTYIRATFHKGDVFFETTVVKNPKFAYILYYELIYIGAQPKFLTYENIFHLFDIVQDVTGSNFNVPHTVFEILYAYPYRDIDDVKTQWRHTSKKKPPQFVPLREVAHITSSTTSKLVGSYFGNAIDSALVNASEQSTEMEELLRQ